MVLGWNRRFASKGGYLVRFVEPTGDRVAADGNWIAPLVCRREGADPTIWRLSRLDIAAPRVYRTDKQEM